MGPRQWVQTGKIVREKQACAIFQTDRRPV